MLVGAVPTASSPTSTRGPIQFRLKNNLSLILLQCIQQPYGYNVTGQLQEPKFHYLSLVVGKKSPCAEILDILRNGTFSIHLKLFRASPELHV